MQIVHLITKYPKEEDPTTPTAISTATSAYQQQQHQQYHQQQQNQQQHHQQQLQHQHQEQQHYDVPKPASEKSRMGDSEMRQGPLNPSPYPHQYHSLPTKPSGGRSYSRVQRDGVGYTEQRVRGHVPKPTQHVQRQQTVMSHTNCLGAFAHIKLGIIHFS